MSNRTQTIQEFQAYYTNITNEINYWFILTVLPIGIITNTLSIYVFTRRALFEKTMMGFYYTNIAVWNVFTLVYQLFVMQYQNLFGFDLYAASEASCKIIYLFRRSIRHIPGSIECMLTLDRFFDVYYPTRFHKIIKNKKIVFCFILFVFLVLNIISIENLFYYIQYTYTNKTTGNRTVLSVSKKCTATRAISNACDLITTLIRTHIPFIIMITLNLLISRRLYKSKSNLGGSSKRPDARKKENQFTRTVLLFNFTFLAFNLPLSIIYIMKITYSYISITPTRISVLIQFAYDMVYMLATALYACFFFVSLAFNKLFRVELLIILGIRTRSDMASSMQVSTTRGERFPSKAKSVRPSPK